MKSDRRYLDALAEALVVELQSIDAQDEALRELRAIDEAFRNHKNVRDRLMHVTSGHDRLLAQLESIAKEHLQLPVAHALLVLFRDGHVLELTEFIDRFKAMRRRLHVAREAIITTAYPLDDAARTRVQKALQERWGLHVTLTERVDPAIIGGLHVSAGDWQFDASVKGKLNRLMDLIKK